MRIYVAGDSDERLTIVRPFLERLRALGAIITHDWTRCEGYDRPQTTAEKFQSADLDINAVSVADVVWVIVPEAKSEGAAAELGAALVLGKYVYVSGPQVRRNIFALLATEIHDTHEDAFAAIKGRYGFQPSIDSLKERQEVST